MTAFLTPLGLLHITSFPTGFINSPSEFQECMVCIFQDEIIPQIMNVFIDDAPICGPSTIYPDQGGNPTVLTERPGIWQYIWEHAVDLNRILHRMAEAGATFSGKKFQICQPQVLILGQAVGVNGREPDTKRVNMIKEWPAPRNITEARQFIGLCGTVRIWISNYSQITSSITSTWKKGVEFAWTEECQEAFDILKELITTAPAILPINYTCERPIIISVDSSYMGVGMILSQLVEKGKCQPSRYGSLPFSKMEAKYSQPKLELYGLFHAFRHFRLYIIGAKHLIVEVDAKYIKGMLNEPKLQPNAVINRWIQGVLLFDFTLVHIPATKFKGSDALSCRPLDSDIEVEPYDDTWLDEIALFHSDYGPCLRQKIGLQDATLETPDAYVLTIAAIQETTLKKIYEYLTNPVPETVTRNFLRKVAKYYTKAGQLFKRTKSDHPLLVIFDTDKQQELMNMAHESLGHHGEKATWENLCTLLYWPQMYQDIHHHVKSCHKCQIHRTMKVHLPITTPPPSTMFTKVHMDIILMPPAKGYCYIVLARDDLSKCIEGRALRKASARTVATFVLEDIRLQYGCIGKIVTDNGPEFKGALSELLKKYSIPQINISPYNSQANGVVEQGHFAIREALVKACQGDIHLWPSKLRAALFADNVTVRRSTGYPAYFLLHGTDPILLFDLWESTFLVEGFRQKLSSKELLTLHIQQIECRDKDVVRAMQILRSSRLASKRQFEKRFETHLVHGIYSPGDLVLIRNTAMEKELNRKTKPRYLGPYKVIRQI
jgi:transposase InsO family protein